MLTLFAIPKAFRGQFEVVQLNALRSWALLRPKPEIILFGDDEGTADAARELNAVYVPTVARNEYGTPLVNELFLRAQGLSSNPYLCYVNSDIILPTDFVQTLERLLTLVEDKPFLGVGRKVNLELRDFLDYGSADWESALRKKVRDNGRFVTYDSDYFLFPRGLWSRIPPFAIGRCYWSSWFVFDAKKRGLPVIDLTPVVVAVESKHDYSHARSTGGNKRLSGVEYELNRLLFKGCRYFTTVDATRVLTPAGLRQPPATNAIRSVQARSTYYVYFLLKGRLYPYSLPLILVLRGLRTAFDWVRRFAWRLRLRLDRARPISV